MARMFAAVVAMTICAPALAHSTSRWTTDKVVGLCCELVDPVRIENYAFTGKGLVAVTVGTKDRITAPLWYWRIRDGRLQLSDEDSIREEFTLVGMRDGILTVRRQSGKIARFHYRFERRKT
jgi:hypothetical protein